jgi:hypothetical protein
MILASAPRKKMKLMSGFEKNRRSLSFMTVGPAVPMRCRPLLVATACDLGALLLAQRQGQGRGHGALGLAAPGAARAAPAGAARAEAPEPPHDACAAPDAPGGRRAAVPPNMATTSLTPVGNSADSPAAIQRPSPATGHEAEMLEVEDPDLGYDAENFPYKPPQRGISPTCREGLLSGLFRFRQEFRTITSTSERGNCT